MQKFKKKVKYKTDSSLSVVQPLANFHHTLSKSKTKVAQEKATKGERGGGGENASLTFAENK